jgi:hypothetical protein
MRRAPILFALLFRLAMHCMVVIRALAHAVCFVFLLRLYLQGKPPFAPFALRAASHQQRMIDHGQGASRCARATVLKPGCARVALMPRADPIKAKLPSRRSM